MTKKVRRTKTEKKVLNREMGITQTEANKVEKIRTEMTFSKIKNSGTESKRTKMVKLLRTTTLLVKTTSLLKMSSMLSLTSCLT